ncbi:MAG: putative Pol polyprotein [Streblomastix strix]|uniref:Putative Pol polyprotein n=1 Tax=Streblomastix strix TaxID=222440 RepID=A0A5J4WNV8_9EUKA|nr:MAG: putative Pol polyprotein [Streblomastix strix]
MIRIMRQWEKIVQNKRFVKVKLLASFIGSLNFQGLQIKRLGLQLKKLNKVKAQAALTREWNSTVYPSMQVLKEIFWWKTMIQKNKPIQDTVISPQAILATDASKTNWGATLKMSHPDLEILFLGKFSNNWHISSSNQRDIAGIFCAIRRSETYLRERQIRALKIETYNSSAENNIDRGSAAVALVKLTDRILETADPNLQLHVFHIPGKLNVIPDSLSRFATSGDYQIHQDVLMEALFALQVRPSIDMFANRRNRKFKRFLTLVLDNWAMGQDCLSHPWSGEVPYLHPPIPMIQATLNKAKQEGVPAVIVVPNWPSQPWWPSLAGQIVKYVNVRRSEDILKPGGRMRKARKNLPPGEILVVLLEEIQINSYSSGSYLGDCLHLKQQTR